MVIYWHKKDFRFLDNECLSKSLEICMGEELQFLPVFGLEKDLIIDQDTGYEFGQFYQYGFISAILPLYKNYLHNGIRCGLFYESIITYLARIVKLEKVKYLISHQEHGTQNTYKRDKEVEKFCRVNGIIWLQIPPSGVVRNLISRDVRNDYVKKYLNGNIIPIPSLAKFDQNKDLVAIIDKDNQEILNRFKKMHIKIGGKRNLENTSENNGLLYLKDFIKNRSKHYVGSISSPNTAILYGSRLSQYLAFGTLSLRYVYQSFWNEIKATDNAKLKRGLLAAMKRLYWREHFIQRIETSSDLPYNSINIDYQNIDYSHKNNLFDAYKAGKTGEPLIDACIRCLHKTGFINFRMRSMLISYAIFGLDLDWRKVGKFLATLFLDYEPGIHWSQVQMQAGVTGINIIRVYSPSKQLLDQDKECKFVKKWVPELENIDNEFILNYNTVDLCLMTYGKYPNPIVNFKIQSKINKDKVYSIRKNASKVNAKNTFIKHGSRKKKTKKLEINDSNSLF